MGLADDRVVVVALVVAGVAIGRAQAPGPVHARVSCNGVAAKNLVLLRQGVIDAQAELPLVGGETLKREVVLRIGKRVVRCDIGQRHIFEHSQ